MIQFAICYTFSFFEKIATIYFLESFEKLLVMTYLDHIHYGMYQNSSCRCYNEVSYKYY